MIPTEAEMCAAVWTWLHQDKPAVVDTFGIAGWVERDGQGLATDWGDCPDYLHDEAASAGLLEEMRQRWVLVVLNGGGNSKAWGVDGVLAEGRAYQSFPRDPDRKRAILLAAWEAAQTPHEASKA